MDYVAFVDADRQVRWYGGSQVNLYQRWSDNWVEFNVASRAEWWETPPTVAAVEDFAREVFRRWGDYHYV